MQALSLLALSIVIIGCGGHDPREATAKIALGPQLYATSCAACHGPKGLGDSDRYPPLIDSPFLQGSAEASVRIVLHGLHGPLKRDDRTYDFEMPGFGPALSDREVAAVITHVRELFGNSTTPVEQADVARIRAATKNRKSYWTPAELASFD